MGWLNTVLDVAILGAEIAQVGQLDDLKKQGATSALIQTVLQEIRSQIFNYKQAAQSILEVENSTPKLAAGAMRVLDLRLNNSGITPELFSDLSDMEYVANTIKFIGDNSKRLLGQFSNEERHEILSMALAVNRLPEYKYYIDHELDYKSYKTAQNEFEKAGPLANGIVSNSIGCVMFIASVVVIGIFASIFRDAPFLGMFIGLIISLAGIYWVGKKSRAGKEAKKRMESLDKKLDLELLARLDQEFSGDRRKAIALQNQAAEQVKAFFGDSSLLPIQS